jgi:hypothetical protein
MLQALGLEDRADVVEQSAGDAAVVGHRQQHGDQPAQRGPEQDETPQLQRRDQSFNVLPVDRRQVGHRILGIIALAAPPQLDADQPPVALEPIGDSFEVARVAGEPGDADDRRAVPAAGIVHFCRFEPLPGNLPQPLALRYHGHQFRVYNPDIGDGRGFLFAQLRDAGRLLDLGTKGSGQTPTAASATAG